MSLKYATSDAPEIRGRRAIGFRGVLQSDVPEADRCRRCPTRDSSSYLRHRSLVPTMSRGTERDEMR